MVRARRVRNAKPASEVTDGNILREDIKMEHSNGFNAKGIRTAQCVKSVRMNDNFSPPTTRSRNQTKKTILDNTNKSSHITNYFQVIGAVKCLDDQNDIHTLYNGKAHAFMNGAYDDFNDFDDDEFKLDIADINEIIYSEKNDKKKIILNNIFKKENCTIAYSSGRKSIRSSVEDEEPSVKEEIVEHDNNDNSEGNTGASVENNDIIDGDEDNFCIPNIRLSPRKHASTLQRCVQVKENIKTPHRIRLCENSESPSHSIKQLSFRPYKHRSKRKLTTKMSKAKPKDLVIIDLCENMAAKDEIVKEEAASNDTVNGEVIQIANNIKSEKQLKMSGTLSDVANHKMTEYFPVRRSVRKTKKEVLEEKQRDLEIAIQEQREEGLKVASFEGKGRGVVASRKFHRGEFVVEYAGELVDIAEARQREAIYAQDHAAGCYMYYFRHNNQNYCIDATAESGRLGRLVNHSRNGNLITKSIFLGSKPHLVLIANQDIAIDEEVTYDYGDRSKESLQHHPWLAL